MTSSLKKIVLFVLLAVALGVVYLDSTHHWPHPHANRSSSTERRALYWYDAMNPEHHYSQPGKAPDGMDLVPAYADAAAREQSSPTAADGRKVLYWYDPMHPTYKSDKPGIAPDCGMTLVPKYADDGMAKMAPGTVTITAAKQSLAGVRTTIVERKALVRELRTTAQIVADERRISHVHVKVSGYIDRVYVDYVGQMVKKGDPLFTLYSPDLVSAEQEYLIARRGNVMLASAPFEEVSHGAQTLLDSTRERLRLWDVSDDEISQLDRTGKVNRTLTFYSPVNGVITDRKAFPQTSVTPDTDLYTVTDLSSVWALVDIYEYEVPYVRVGQRVVLSLSYYPGKTYTGTISFIDPIADPQTHTVKVRVQLPNPDYVLKPQMFADATLRIDYGRHVVIPQEAILDSGMEQRVFVVHPGGSFESRKVTLGPAVNGDASVLAGLKPGERVVTSGNFLIDSESRLNDAVSGMGNEVTK